MQHKHVQQEVAQSPGSMDHVQAVMIVDFWNLHFFKTKKIRSIGTLYSEALFF